VKATAGTSAPTPTSRDRSPASPLKTSSARSNMTNADPTSSQPNAASPAHIPSTPSRPGPTCIRTSAPRISARSASIASRSGQDLISTGGGDGGSEGRGDMHQTLSVVHRRLPAALFCPKGDTEQRQ